ncbi:MAG: T9SS type A sorting domain-containing protein [Gemmatimonadetes bacterium]|nr:T9SS type A sorting domain-containing protein [Gemmatimonadota bacterium]
MTRGKRNSAIAPVLAALLWMVSAVPAECATYDDLLPLARHQTAPGAKQAASHDHAADQDGRKPFPCVLGSGGVPEPSRGVRTGLDYLRKGGREAARKSAADIDTVRVACFRIDWEEDSAGDLTTAEGGRFLTEPDSAWPYLIDAPPHDSTYFNTHMSVLREYIRRQSYGRQHVEWEIFPKSENGTYRLGDTQDYLPEGDSDDWDLIERSDLLVKFCTDAILLVDSVDAAVDFSEYDGYIVFHAGPDLQTDINQDSPGDIPSFFLSLGDSDIVHVDVEEDSFPITTVTCLPEYDSQDGFIFGLNGVLAHEFGHQLGLPDLYSTSNFFPAVGQWDLMDSGGLVSIGSAGGFLTGIIPASFSAWCKFYLGWIDPIVIDEPGAVTLTAATFGEADTTARFAMVPLNESEYYLVENRIGLAGEDDFAARIDTLNNVVLGPVTNDEERTPTGDYDFPLPGWGTLVWHVNERILSPINIFFNVVNTVYNNKGLELEEADGIREIGNPFSAYWDGSPNDPWRDDTAEEFGPRTAPNTNTTDGGVTGVSITGFPAVDTVVTIQFDVRSPLPGFPVPMTADSIVIEPAGLHVFADRAAAFWISIDTAGALYAGATTYTPGEDGPAITRDSLPGLPTTFSVAGSFRGDRGEEAVTFVQGRGYLLEAGGALLELEGGVFDTLLADPMALTFDAAMDDRIVTLGPDSSRTFAVSGDSLIVTDRTNLPGRPRSNLAAIEKAGRSEFAYVGTGGLLHVRNLLTDGPAWESTAALDDTTRAWLLSGNIDRADSDEWIVVFESGKVAVLGMDGTMHAGWPVSLGVAVTGEPLFTDRNGDGMPELAIPTEERLHILTGYGFPQRETPLRIPEVLRTEEFLVNHAVAIDFGGGAEPIATDEVGRLYRWTDKDELVDSWPRSSGAWNSLLQAAPGFGDDSYHIYTLARDGHMYSFPLDTGAGATVLWPASGGGPGRRFLLDETLLGSIAEPDPGAPLDLTRAYCYPNPLRAENAKVRFTLTDDADVGVQVVDLAGQEMHAQLVPGRFGENEIVLDTGSWASGVYVVRLEAGDRVEFVKLAIAR